MVFKKRQGQEYHIHISEAGFLDLVLPVIELAMIPGTYDESAEEIVKGLEVYGSLFGHVSHDGLTTNIFVEIATASPTSESTQKGVKPNRDAVDLINEVVNDISPDLKLLGSFHSHPYMDDDVNSKRIQDQRLYELSAADKRHFISSRSSIDVIVTVARRAEEDIPHHGYVEQGNRNGGSALRFDLRNMSFWIKAYVSESEDLRKAECRLAGSSTVVLRCPTVTGWMGPKPGRYRPE